MEDKITLRRSLVGESEAIRQNKEHLKETIIMLETRIEEMKEKKWELEKREKLILDQAEQLQDEITKEINTLLDQITSLGEKNDRYEQNWYRDDNEKFLILQSYKEEEKLIDYLLNIKQRIKVEFWVERKRRILSKKE